MAGSLRALRRKLGLFYRGIPKEKVLDSFKLIIAKRIQNEVDQMISQSREIVVNEKHKSGNVRIHAYRKVISRFFMS